jgi:hypothetical protein
MLNFGIGVLSGIGLSGIALYGATRLAKPLEKLFTVNPINTTTTVSGTHKMAQIINRETPVERALKTDE